MTEDELQMLAEASKVLTRAEYRKDAARLNAIITMEGGNPTIQTGAPLGGWPSTGWLS